MLEVVETERLFSYRQDAAEGAMPQNVQAAVELLVSQDSRFLALAVDTLAVLARIDQDLTAPFMPRILPKLLLLVCAALTPYVNYC